ncbi:conserved hypothetical protein [Verticillium alfalfae VaMs.102]|uniref:Nuclear pore complex protein Nup85 n=1 Tax=Verticillium alfalfae (strain VaMs.102 / ATCC MYA-4576 / FGSC 10136) TaxID=526221 RepID=C9S6J5_VERA1|nr:conserved hypothetical protein [Verticillium alfalfae VaMs.102]EEY14486.1 conserved hypothetical protein [Verticillium alfalfae VaMs.102]
MPTFSFPDDSPAPSTPDRSSHFGSGSFQFGDNPSTTPAGPPPPSSAASFTPAGAPSESYLGSSMMLGVTGQKPTSFGGHSTAGSTKNLFGRAQNSPQQPLGRSIGPSRSARQPSALSREYDFADSTRSTTNKTGTYHISSDEESDEDEEEEVDEVAEADEQMKRILEADMDDESEEGSVEEDEEDEEEYDEEGEEDTDMFLDMHQRARQQQNQDYDEDEDDAEGDEDEYEENLAEATDFMDLVTPAATEQMRKEARDIFRASVRQRSSAGSRTDFQYASMAKNLYTDLGFAQLSEAPELIGKTEDTINKLYDEGIGAQEDPEKLDSALSLMCEPLIQLWDDYADSLPMLDSEHTAEVGPGDDDEPFRKGAFVAKLVLRLHNARLVGPDASYVEPLPGVLFDWAAHNHNMYPDQHHDVMRHRPSPANHGLYWQTVGSALMRGNVDGAIELLRGGAWGGRHKRPRRKGLSGQNSGKSTKDNWDIFSSDWTLFRIQAKGSLDKLQRFAEGKERDMLVDGSDDGFHNGPSLASMARKAESQVPWDIYEHLQTIYEIALGVPDAILDTAQDWCEAAVGMFGWWEAERNHGHDVSLRMSRSRSQALALPAPSPGPDAYFERLAIAIHTVVESNFHFNAMNPVEVALVSALEGNYTAVVGFLRAWSLPVASAVAELASLGQWLPKPEAPNLIALQSLDMEDSISWEYFAETWRRTRIGTARLSGTMRLRTGREKVREVLNLLMSYSLLQSTVFPPTNDLDDHLHRLLTERSQTLEQYAKQDLEAAQLLGRMLSGYATLRKFYELRDTEGLANMSSYKSLNIRRQAASALVAVVASSDDNIRGGLYDESRDAVVSEDFLLALLGEALPFINQGSSEAIITLDQIHTLLKAVEDIETVSPTVFDAADEYFKLVLASAQGLKGSSPHDLMRKSTGGLSGSSSYVMDGSSMLASQLHRSVSGGSSVKFGSNVRRGWDWRSGLLASATSKDVLRILRLGLSKNLSKLWLAEADNASAI